MPHLLLPNGHDKIMPPINGQDSRTGSSLLREIIASCRESLSYDVSKSNPDVAMQERRGNCIAYALLACMQAEKYDYLAPGIFVVSSEIAAAPHCMAGIIDRESQSCFVIDTRNTQTQDSDKKHPATTLHLVSKDDFHESVFGGMMTSLTLLDELLDVANFEGVATKEATIEDDWRYWMSDEQRYSTTLVTAFFGRALQGVKRYYREGIDSSESQKFRAALTLFDRKKTNPTNP